MTRQKWEFYLDSTGIDACVETIQGISKEYLEGVAQSGTIAFSAELVLLNFQKHFGKDRTFELEFIDRFGKVNLYIKLKGDGYDPRINSQAKSEDDEFSSIILNKYTGEVEEYKYEQGVNIVHRSVKKKARLGSGTKILIGFAVGIIFGLLGLLFSATTQESLGSLLDTINGIILDLIIMGATLVVFMMVVNSISGFGSISTVKKTGSCIIKKYLWSYLLAIAMFFLYIIVMFTFTIDSGNGAGGSILTIFTETIAGIFPHSSLSPFVDCDFLQIIFLAVMIGIAMLVIGDSTKPIRVFCESFEVIADQILDWFCGLLPIFVFTMVPSLIWQGQLAEMAQALLQLLGIAVAAIIVFIIRLGFMCGKLKMSPMSALKILKPAMLQGLMTGSSTASTAQIQSAIRGFKVKESYNSFATAMGLIFEIASAFMGFLILSFYLIVVSGSTISISTIISLLIICLLLSIASPPVNGGAIAIEFIIAGMFDIPDVYLAVVPPIMLIFDFIATGLRCGGMAIVAASTAKTMGEIED